MGANKYFNAHEKGEFSTETPSSESDKKPHTFVEALVAKRLSVALESQQISQIQN